MYKLNGYTLVIATIKEYIERRSAEPVKFLPEMGILCMPGGRLKHFFIVVGVFSSYFLLFSQTVASALTSILK